FMSYQRLTWAYYLLQLGAPASFALLDWLYPPTAVVGSDGVLVERLVGRTFVRYADIAAVVPYERGVLLRKVDGKEVSMPTSTAWGASSRTRASRRRAASEQRSRCRRRTRATRVAASAWPPTRAPTAASARR